MEKIINLTVNGELQKISVQPYESLLEVLRDKLDLTGTKYGCGTGECGNCTVLLNGKPILSCLTLAVAVDGKDVLTIEGLAKNGELDPIQKMFVEYGAVQCGHCTPGMVLTAKALLNENPNPTEEEVREYISGVLCRCTGYVKIVDAILAVAKGMREKQ